MRGPKNNRKTKPIMILYSFVVALGFEAMVLYSFVLQVVSKAVFLYSFVLHKVVEIMVLCSFVLHLIVRRKYQSFLEKCAMHNLVVPNG